MLGSTIVSSLISSFISILQEMATDAPGTDGKGQMDGQTTGVTEVHIMKAMVVHMTLMHIYICI